MTAAVRTMTWALTFAWALAWTPAEAQADVAVGYDGVPEALPSYDTLMTHARDLATAGRPAEAAALLDDSTNRFPDDYELHLARGYYHLSSGAFSSAEAAYRLAMGLSDGARDARLGLTDAMEAQGRHGEAADGYLRILADTPDDPDLYLRLAWSRYQAGDTAAARAAYEQALALRPSDLDARLGLGWCDWKDGRRAQARRRFHAVLASAPDNPSARDGLARTPIVTAARLRGFGFGDLHVGHPWRRWQAGASAGVDLRFDDRFRLDLGYQYLHIDGRIDGAGDDRGPGAGGSKRVRTEQHEAHGILGWDSPAWGVMVHGAYLHYDNNGSEDTGPGADSGVLGLAGRYRHWADFRLGAVHSWYDDFGVFQGMAGVELPVASFADLLAGFEFQWADGRFWPSGSAGVRFHGARWSVLLDGTFGTRCRPVDLATQAIYNTVDRISGSAGVRAAFALGDRTWMIVEYRFKRLLAPALSGARAAQSAYSHGLTIGWIVDSIGDARP